MDAEELAAWRIERLIALAKKIGGQAALGRALGYKDGAFVGQMIRGERPVTEKTVLAAEALPGCSGWFTASQNIVATNVAAAPALVTSGMIPVVGHVKGGDDGYLEELSYPVGGGEGFVEYWVRDTSAYALRVRGDSMHPRYRAGEFVVVTPGIEPVPGRDVIVKLRNGKKLLKQLNWVRGDEIQLLSINNNYGPMTIQRSEIDGIQRVAGSVPPDAFIEPSKQFSPDD